MGRPEELEAEVGELEGELRALLDEYVEVQQRLQTLEALTGGEGELAADRTLADLPERVRQAARADEGAPSAAPDSEAASQAEVAAAVERVEAAVSEDRHGEGTATDDGDDDPDADGGATDIIVG